MNEIYDYSSREGRVRTARFLFEYAKSYRLEEDEKWSLFYDYYNGHHRTQAEIAQSCQDAGIPWIPAISSDPFLQVETQIISGIPSFEFRGRDSDMDSLRAKQREFVTRYVLDRNHVAELAISNERRCHITGSAAWKVYWDSGEVKVCTVDPRCLYPDPCAKSVDECEFIQYVYPLHRRSFARAFRNDIARLDIDVDSLARRDDVFEGETYSAGDDVVSVTEHWYRDADGDICCSVQCGGYELRHIEKYWQTTAQGCNLYPFVMQRRISDPDSFWGRGDIEPIITLVDCVDRELSVAQLQSAFYGHDVILAEHDAFSEEPENRPGALWRLKPGAMGKVQRLGGLGSNENRLEMVEKLRALICETLGTLDIDRGISNTSLTSATALSQLIERSEERSAPKRRERTNAFVRLYRLIDWTALEFYTEERMIFLGVDTVNDMKLLHFDPKAIRDENGYYPEVDVIIESDSGVGKSTSFALSAIETLLSHEINAENYPLVIELLRIVDLDEAAKLEEYYKNIFRAKVNGDDAECEESTDEILENVEVYD